MCFRLVLGLESRIGGGKEGIIRVIVFVKYSLLYLWRRRSFYE